MNLFNIPESKSPRLLWMERNGITTHESIELIGDAKWTAKMGDTQAFGATENEALIDVAQKKNLKLWNQ